MTGQAYSILAIYNAVDGGGPIIRHIGTVVRGVAAPHAFVEAHVDGLSDKARATLPPGAACLSAMCTLPVGYPGYDATMAKVNVGTKGVPA